MQDFSELLNSENSDPENQGVLTTMMYELIDEMSLGMSFEVHRAAKIGTLFLDETDAESQKRHELVNERGLDIFGQVPTKKQYECVCPNCGRNMAASRFAPHLEKCMGMGRNSSRIASRRIANATQKKDSDDDSDEQDPEDNEWGQEKKTQKLQPLVKRIKKEKSNNNHTKKTKLSKPKNGDSTLLGGGNSADLGSLYDQMTLEEKKALLMTTCGVISEHTKKMCTKSLRCPQHTETQRRAVRAFLLGQPSVVEWLDTSWESSDPLSDVPSPVWLYDNLSEGESQRHMTSFQQAFIDHIQSQDPFISLDPEEHVDIDTYTEEEGQSLAQTLQWEAVSNPSPADSNSTTGSTSRRRKCKGLKKKNAKPVSRSDTPSSNYELP